MSELKGFSDGFIASSLYAPEHWYLHELLEIDHETHRVRALMDTTRLGALVDAQRTESGHALHVPAACVIQATGVLGNIHAREVLGLLAEDGWFGYGTRITQARFHTMGRIGPAVIATCSVTKRRRVRGIWFVDCEFEFTQEGALIYSSQQSAVWLQRGSDDRAG